MLVVSPPRALRYDALSLFHRHTRWERADSYERPIVALTPFANAYYIPIGARDIGYKGNAAPVSFRKTAL